jgi:hypothetical protein
MAIHITTAGIIAGVATAAKGKLLTCIGGGRSASYAYSELHI